MRVTHGDFWGSMGSRFPLMVKCDPVKSELLDRRSRPLVWTHETFLFPCSIQPSAGQCRQQRHLTPLFLLCHERKLPNFIHLANSICVFVLRLVCRGTFWIRKNWIPCGAAVTGKSCKLFFLLQTSRKCQAKRFFFFHK